MTDRPTPAAINAAAIGGRLASILDRLQTLHADAEAARLPQGVTRGLRWLCEDATSTLAHLRRMMAEQKGPTT
jgi:hypothetical protein